MCYNSLMNLAARMRPESFQEFLGQHHIVGGGKLIQRMIDTNDLYSIIFWGPPGSGKTTLARLIAKHSSAEFFSLSGVGSGKEDLRQVVVQARKNQDRGVRSILFIDEIHRWNKAQQDTLLPFVESGLITLIGATTENPSFEVIGALLSRCKVFVLFGLNEEDLSTLIDRALTDVKKGVGNYKKTVTAEAKELLVRLSGGDGRILLNALETAVVSFREKKITPDIIREVFQTKSAGLYDKKAEEHYNIVSAFIKSMRGSDPDAALYYLMRMLENGEDPKFIARRMIIFAAEDIGVADRGALIQANEAFDAVHKIGMPEAQLILGYAAVYLARAPKSRLIPNALTKAKAAVYDYPNEPVPLHLRNAPTKLMKGLGYAKDYLWSDRYVGPTKDTSFLPTKLKSRKFLEQDTEKI